MQQAAKSYLSPAEYLALEDAAEYKSEYRNGEIIAMAGGSSDHNCIIGNFFDGCATFERREKTGSFSTK